MRIDTGQAKAGIENEWIIDWVKPSLHQKKVPLVVKLTYDNQSVRFHGQQ